MKMLTEAILSSICQLTGVITELCLALLAAQISIFARCVRYIALQKNIHLVLIIACCVELD